MKSRKGFSLIETAIGLVIFGLIGIAILVSLAATSKSNIVNGRLTVAESLGRAQMEYVENHSYITAGSPYPVYPINPDISIPTSYSFDTTSVHMATSINGDGSTASSDTGLQKISVSVKYDNLTLFTLTNYKVNR